mmetsp:Transcript_50367/g.79833  ORF Transcript_50367/g.79833 Transcript_50367/m.79833 type:complete len:118 (-) Transcript_50367:1152-1505(-)
MSPMVIEFTDRHSLSSDGNKDSDDSEIIDKSSQDWDGGAVSERDCKSLKNSPYTELCRKLGLMLRGIGPARFSMLLVWDPTADREGPICLAWDLIDFSACRTEARFAVFMGTPAMDW